MARIFYEMMKDIGEEMHQSTRALAISNTVRPTILDMCMAPGGFVAKTLEKNPGACVLGLSLPVSQGGHEVLLPGDPSVTLEFLDITMLAADMGVIDIPREHPDARNMLPQRFKSSQLFDLVLCDGQVLRTHSRAAYRETREARRLASTQLAIGLEHVKSGGSMIVLLHKVEGVDTVSLLHTFSKFSSVTLFKPSKHHAKRSSFYVVATNIQSQCCEAIRAVERWKRQWRIATLGTDSECKEEFRMECWKARKLLEEFGEELIELGREIWNTQSTALKKAPFIKRRWN
jgi:23S rRNA U2552 (ribose-2'-O)-methylase RlmE/FtsJ